MTQTEIIQILAGFVGSIGFAILFNIRGKSLIATAIGGLFSWLLFVILSKYIKNEPFVYFIIACVISTYAEIMARVLKTPSSAFITTSLIPLIPGGSLYYTMVHAFEGDLHAFLPKAIYTMKLASALALGIIVSTSVARIFNKEFFHKNRNKI
ncbi:MAG: threonine/serine exporter family protein [Acutalibacteraceae bacterium]|nr:threonine/serine exporter family protein [Acutalibacteraceae bacterium]